LLSRSHVHGARFEACWKKGAPELSELFRSMLDQLYACFLALDERIAWFDREIEKVFKNSETCQRLAQIRGVGPKTATAIVAAVGDASEFNNGRHLAAWMGLVPRQQSSGNRQSLFGISKRANRHLRTLLIYGARAVVRHLLAETMRNRSGYATYKHAEVRPRRSSP